MSTVPPPGGILGSNSNYTIASAAGQCAPITDLIVTIDITQDIVLKSSSSLFADGYGFQLNGYSPPNFLNAWQQFIYLVYGVDLRPVELEACENDYSAKEEELTNHRDVILVLPDTTLPAGYQLQIQLKTDANNKVVGVLYVVNDIGFLPACKTALTGYWFKDTSAVVTNSGGNTSGNTNNSNQDKNPTEQHINYIGIDGHIHERFRRSQGNWISNDLSALAGSAVLPAAHSALDAYPDADLGQHVNFIGTDGHVHELYITLGGHWVDNDLNALSKGVTPMTGSPLDAYTDGDKGQHVNFIGIDGHVHELFIASGGHWINNDLIALSGNSTPPRPNSPLDGYVDNDNAQHVNFIGTDGHVHELYITPHGHWVNNDLTVLSGNGIAPSRTSPLCGYMAQDNGQHVDFIGTDGHVHELYILPGAHWVNNDLTHLANSSVLPGSESTLCGCWAADQTQHVSFIGTDGHVHDLSIPPHGHWTDSDLTVLSANSTTPAADGALHSCAQPDGDVHINFVGMYDDHLRELLLAPLAQWVNNDLDNIPLANFLKSPIDLRPDQFAPICAVQLNLVGPYNSDSATFSSGAGNFIYASSTPLTVLTNIPSCAPFQLPTGETSNSVYGELDPGPSNVITQSFSIDTTERIIRFQGPVSKGTQIDVPTNTRPKSTATGPG